MHEEEWFKNLEPAMSHLTLKTSYSLTAERPSVTNAYAIIDSKIPWRPFTSVNESMLYVKEVANQDLTYEKSMSSISA